MICEVNRSNSGDVIHWKLHQRSGIFLLLQKKKYLGKNGKEYFAYLTPGDDVLSSIHIFIYHQYGKNITKSRSPVQSPTIFVNPLYTTTPLSKCQLPLFVIAVLVSGEWLASLSSGYFITTWWKIQKYSWKTFKTLRKTNFPASALSSRNAINWKSGISLINSPSELYWILWWGFLIPALGFFILSIPSWWWW